MVKRLLCAWMGVCLAVGTAWAQQDQLFETARKTMQSYEKAVITLSAVLKFEAKGMDIGDRESKTQCVAAIIDPSGLALCSLTSLSPQSTMGKIRINGAAVELECQVLEVKYRLADGTEVPARVVLKDEDLDLAFLAPLKPLDEPTRQKMAVIPLADAASTAALLDSTIFISRATDDLNYAPMLEVDKVVAVLSTPRTCYLGNVNILGTAVFNRQGKYMGIVTRCIKTESSGDNVLRFSTSLSTTSRLILPASDVTKLLPQAKEEMKKSAETEKKDTEKKDTEKKDTEKKDTEKKGTEKKDVEKKDAKKPGEKK